MRIKSLHLITMFSFLGLMSACVGGSNFSEVPEIAYISISKDTLNQGDLLNDSLDLVFAFRDGNGDIGTSEMFSQNIRLVDTRTDEVLTSFKTPRLPEAGANGGIEGTITLKVFTQCCIFDNNPNLLPCTESDVFVSEEFQIDIQLTDDFGNESNIVRSDLITLLCN